MVSPIFLRHSLRYVRAVVITDRSNAPGASMRSLRAFLAAAVVVSCRDPRAEANIAQAMMQIGTEISAIRQDYAVLQSEVDSLRNVVAKQDSLIVRLTTTVANIPIGPR